MIWAAERNREQSLLVAAMYRRSGAVPCRRIAVVAGGLPGADKAGVLTEAGVDRSRYLAISIGLVLEEMAARDLIPRLQGLSPLDAAELVHGEAQFLAKRLAMRALADGRDVIFDISMTSAHSVQSWLAALRWAGYAVTRVFAEISIEESVRRCEAEHRHKHEAYRNGVGCGGRYVRTEAIRALPVATNDMTRAQTQASAAAIPPVASGPGGRSPGAAFPGGEVTGMIAAYQAGKLSLGDLVLEFQARCWPAVASACPPGMEQAAPAIDDPEPYVPGTFDEVVLAYDLGHLTDADYKVLAEAASS